MHIVIYSAFLSIIFEQSYSLLYSYKTSVIISKYLTRTSKYYISMAKRSTTTTATKKRKVPNLDGDASLKLMESKLPYYPSDFNCTRARLITCFDTNSELNLDGKCVVLWMSRDQRVNDNYAIEYAQSIAIAKNVPLKVVFNLVPKFLEATLRQYSFMIDGLKEVEQELRKKEIPFYLLMGDPVVTIPKFAYDNHAMVVVTDFSPLRVPMNWVKSVGSILDSTSTTTNSTIHSNIKIPLVQVDAHNVIPCWIASDKLEYAARTIRNKIQSKLPEYLKDMKELVSNPVGSLITDNQSLLPQVDWKQALASLQIDRSVLEVSWIKPGAIAGWNMVESFMNDRLKIYSDKRNDPNMNGLSNLSPYFHFGQISVQKVVLHLKKSKLYPSSTDNFIEEAIVRRELADNFCYYNSKYDVLEGCADWAKETLRIHSTDIRTYIYSKQQLEVAHTHDDLWNAAQIQMIQEGKMHGFLRMYWAKKILEWTNSPEEALSISIYLNDKYNLDGRDPNGYVGCMWSIGGIHDQGWGEREIFGKIRYMNYKGCERKFDVKTFVKKYPPAAENAKNMS